MGVQSSPAKNQRVSLLCGVYVCEFLPPTIPSLIGVQKRLSNPPKGYYKATLQRADPWTLMPPQHAPTELRCP